MINRLDLRLHEFPMSKAAIRKLVPRPKLSPLSVIDQVQPIITDIAEQGLSAILKYTQQFDQILLERIRVPQSVLDSAVDQLEPQLRESLEAAITRVRAVHTAQLPQSHSTALAPGAWVHQRWVPVERVGLYVPGGKAVYPSSVIMNSVPALIAGVESLVVCSPPQKAFHGLPHPSVLATCALLGVPEVWAVGGAVAVAVMAYGAIDTDATVLEPVDLITGPGNVYVAAAKRLVSSEVGIDAEAGPTEIAIIADDSAIPEFIAWDLISQAEHDPLAASILITTSAELADKVEVLLESFSAETSHTERITTALSGDQSRIIVVSDLDAAIAIANVYAAEHLEIHTYNPAQIAAHITNAGAIFLGPYAPVPLGDYAAGSNHVLPTSAHARYQSGLSTLTFMKLMNIVDYDQSALTEIGSKIIHLAEAENLPAHGQAIAVRLAPETVEK